MIARLNIKIFGKVQGVSFRYYASQKAQELSLCGFVRNEPDGTVYIEAEGEEKNLQKFLDWCRKGPETAKVEKVDFMFSADMKNFAEFEVC